MRLAGSNIYVRFVIRYLMERSIAMLRVEMSMRRGFASCEVVGTSMCVRSVVREGMRLARTASWGSEKCLACYWKRSLEFGKKGLETGGYRVDTSMDDRLFLQL